MVIEFVSLNGAFQVLAAAEDDPEEASNKLARVLARSERRGRDAILKGLLITTEAKFDRLMSPRHEHRGVEQSTGAEWRRSDDSREREMGKLIVHMFVTLDGVYQAPGEPDEDLDGGFQLGGWQAPYLDAESGQLMFDEMASLDALLLGRKTYAIFANYWPNAPAEVPFTGLLNATQKYVASRTLQAADWNPTTIIRRVPEDIARLKDEHHEVHVSGSGDLVHTLLREELVDRLNLWIYPVVLSSGKRLFDGGPRTNAWRLVTSTPFATGVVHLGYELAGAPVYGDTGLDAAGGDWPPKPSRAVLEKMKRPADPDA